MLYCLHIAYCPVLKRVVSDPAVICFEQGVITLREPDGLMLSIEWRASFPDKVGLVTRTIVENSRGSLRSKMEGRNRNK